MDLPRRYAADDIRELVDFLAKDPERTPESLAGMQELVAMLKHFENMTDQDIEAMVRRHWSDF